MLIKKLSVGVLVLAVAFVFSAVPTNAQALDRKALLDAGLTDAEATLFMSLLGGATTESTTTSTGVGCSVDFLRDLSTGSQGADVQELQRWLNANGYTVATAGAAGSAGAETMFYGPATASAVTAFQTAYASEILAPLGLTMGTGYFGASSRAKVRDLCASQPTTPSTPDTDDEDEDEDEDMNMDLDGGEASLEDYDMSSGQDSDVEEGQTAEIAEFEFDVEDGDVEVNRVDVTFVKTDANGDDEPWDVFESARLLADGEEIAEMDIDDEDDWLNDGFTISTASAAAITGASTEGFTLRFSGLDAVVREGDTPVMTLELTAQNNVDDADLGAGWAVFVGEEGVRAVDSEGIQNYTGDDADVVEFDVDEAGEGEDLNIRRSSNDPDSATIQVEDDANSDDYTVFAFGLEAEDNDIDLDTISINVRTGTAVYNNVVRDAYLLIDGEEFDDLSVTAGGSTNAVLEFDINSDFTVDEDEEVEVELVLEFRAAAGTLGTYTSGETVRAGNNIVVDWEGADDDQTTSSLQGDLHTLQTQGLAGELVSDSALVTVVDGNDNDYATFTLRFELTAFEEDAYISENVATSINYVLEDATGAAIVPTGSAVLSSTADRDGGYYFIAESDTETFTLTVTYVPTTVGAQDVARLQLVSVEFNENQAAPNDLWLATPAQDYETDYVTIVN